MPPTLNTAIVGSWENYYRYHSHTLAKGIFGQSSWVLIEQLEEMVEAMKSLPITVEYVDLTFTFLDDSDRERTKLSVHIHELAR